MKILKTYQESYPQVKLVGKRFTNEDRKNGTFGIYWQQAFEEGWFEALKACKAVEGVSGDYVGAMRTSPDGAFEYWIGCFFAPDTDVPAGFESVEVPAGKVGVCWLYGSEQKGELYGMEAFNLCMASFQEQGWSFSENGWVFERYNCPRFTDPDAEGNVILDICVYLA